MIYLSDQDICNLGYQWPCVSNCIREGMRLIHAEDFAQPVKPYLRFGNPKNRIIAMPAYAGGTVDTAGIKWIASFPDNIKKGLDRAHSVTILNQASTGIPFCVVNTNRISAIRTAGVTSVIIQEYLAHKKFPRASVKIGLTGFGPIGQTHLDMCATLFGDLIETVFIYDPKPIDLHHVPEEICEKVVIAGDWQTAYEQADIFITCTVSSQRYIDMPPKPGSLHCNISLRDYQNVTMKQMDRMIVDDWDEICREKTDVEFMHLEEGLTNETVYSFNSHELQEMFEGLKPDETIMFNPMGMAVFDICTARLFYDKALELEAYSQIPDGRSYYIFNKPDLLKYIPSSERVLM
ncbi:MAG: 2,3-diaminopropionate biosynthesis protein SbnB [Chitinophagaceae bacterium]